MLSLDIIILGVPDVRVAFDSYSRMLSPIVAGDYDTFVDFDMRGTGHIGLYGSGELAREAGLDPTSTGFRGAILSYIVSQPTEVKSVLSAAGADAATILKPAKGGFFGGFSGSFRAADGTIWKISCEAKKDTAAPANPPIPSETAVLLGVEDPKASRTFYEALGMTVDRDYGKDYIDMEPTSGSGRLGFMNRKSLARDVGVDADGSGFGNLVLSRNATSREEVDSIMTTAEDAGASITAPAADTDWGGYVGHFADPDGTVWKIAFAGE